VNLNFHLRNRDVHGDAAAAAPLPRRHRGSGAAAAGFLKFITAAAEFFLRM